MSWLSNFRSRRDTTELAERTFDVIGASPLLDSDSALPRFKAMANDSDRGSRGLAGAAEQPQPRLQRAFTPSQPIRDLLMFAGRKDLLLSLIRATEEDQMHAVIFGDRGMGKTSLLNMLGALAREARYIVHYSSCSESSTFDTIFRAVCQNIPLLYHADIDPTSEKAERDGRLSELLPPGELSVALLTEAFAKLSGTRVLVLIDEFDRAQSVELRRSIAGLIKALSDRSIRVQIILAGVAGNLAGLFEHIPSIRRNLVGIAVTPMSEAEVLELIRNGESRSGLIFTKAAVDCIVDVALGSPYIAGLICQQSASLTIHRQSRTVEISDVSGALRRAVDDARIRIAPTGQQQVDALSAEAPLSELTDFARLSLTSYGFISDDENCRTERRNLITSALKIGAIEPVTLGNRKGYRFVDESVPFLIWLDAQRSRTADPSQIGTNSRSA